MRLWAHRKIIAKKAEYSAIEIYDTGEGQRLVACQFRSFPCHILARKISFVCVTQFHCSHSQVAQGQMNKFYFFSFWRCHWTFSTCRTCMTNLIFQEEELNIFSNFNEANEKLRNSRDDRTQRNERNIFSPEHKKNMRKSRTSSIIRTYRLMMMWVFYFAKNVWNVDFEATTTRKAESEVNKKTKWERGRQHKWLRISAKFHMNSIAVTRHVWQHYFTALCSARSRRHMEN